MGELSPIGGVADRVAAHFVESARRIWTSADTDSEQSDGQQKYSTASRQYPMKL